MAILPSPPPDANATQRGLVSISAQTIAGVKTFTSALLANAGVQTGSLYNTNGTGASDAVVKVGTTQTFAAANATAKIFSVWYGLGGVETEHLTLTKNGLYFNGYPNSTISCSGSWLDLGVLPIRSVSYFFSTTTYGQTAFYSTGGAYASNNRVNIWSENATGASDVAVRVGPTQNDGTINASCTLFEAGTALAGTFVQKFAVEKRGVYVNDLLEIGGSTGTRYMDSNVALTVNTSAKTWLYNCYEGGAHRSSLTRQGRSAIGQGTIATEAQGASHRIMASFGTNEPTLRVQQRSTHTEPIIEGWHNFDTTPLKVWQLQPTGRVDVKGDNSATVGNETKNNPTGINTLASGATSVVITNSLVSTASHIVVTFHADPGGRVWVTKAAGSFTVNTSAAPGANAPFSWEVKGLI